MYSFAVADFAKKSRVWPVTLYPHTSRKLQPLGRTVFGPFKRFHSNALANPNTVFSINSVAGIAKIALDLVFTPNKIISGVWFYEMYL